MWEKGPDKDQMTSSKDETTAELQDILIFLGSEWISEERQL